MSETSEQRDAVLWFRAKYPRHIKAMRVSMGGMPRHGKKGAVLWSYMKGQGVLKGEADISILIPRGKFSALLIEHKGANQSHSLTEDQQEYLDYHNSVGNLAISTRGFDVLTAAIDTNMGM